MLNKKINFLLVFILLSVSVIGGTYTQDYTNFGLGNFNNTEISNNRIILSNGYSTGTYESEVKEFDNLITTNNFQSLFYSINDIEHISYDDMISYYKFDESSGEFKDSHINGYNLSNSNVIYSQDGVIGDSVYYNGASDSYSIINPYNVVTFNEFTISFWVKANVDDDSTIFSYASSVEKEEFGVHDLNDLRFYIDTQDFDSNIDITDNQFHHVAYSWNSNTGLMQVYLDGVATASTIIKQGYTFTNGGALVMGQLQDSVGVMKAGKEFTGYLDEFNIYDSVLNSDEIKQIYGKRNHTIQVEVKTCDDELCEGEVYTTLTNPQNENLILAENIYFQSKVTLNGLIDSTPYYISLDMNFTEGGEFIPVETLPNQEYHKIGYDNLNSYNNDLEGVFNENVFVGDLKSGSRPLNNEENLASPKVAYLGDDKKYIIASNINGIVLYQWNDETENLDIINGFNFPNGELAGDFVIHNFNGENNIVVPLKTLGAETLPQRIIFITYDGDTFDYTEVSTGTGYGMNNVNSPSRDLVTYATQLNCYDDYCITSFVRQYNIPFVGNYGRLRVVMLDKNGLIDSYEDTARSFLYESGQGTCLFTPLGATPLIGNVDNDFYEGDEYDYTDVIITYSGVETNTLRMYLYSLDVFNDTLELDWVSTRNLNSMSSNCNSYPYPYIHPSSFTTGAVALDYNGVDGDGQEIIVGVLDTWDDYILEEFTSGGSHVKRHPDFFNIEGVLLSNPVKTTCYEDSAGNDVGILSYDEGDQQVIFMCTCGSCAGQDDCEFRDTDESRFYNVSDLVSVSHSVHPLNVDDDIYSELVTPFGIYDIEPPDGGICTSQEFTKLFDVTERDSFIVPVDYQNNGRADLIFSSASIIKYLDDGFSNKMPYIDELSFNPCAGDETLFRGTDILIKAKAYDEENDLVSFRVKLYANTENEIDSGWSEYQTTTTEYRFDDILNYDIGVGYIEIYVKDSKHSEYNMIEQIFSVDNNSQSASFRDCENSLTSDELIDNQDTGDIVSTTSDEYEDEFGNKINDNAVKNSVDEIGESLGLGGFIIYLIVMFAVALAMYFYGTNHKDTMGTFGGIAIVEFLLLVVGTYLKIIPTSVFITLVIFMVLIIGMWIRNIIASRNRGFE